MDDLPINLDLMKNPLNWIIVFFMFALPIAVIGAAHNRLKSTSP